MKKRFNTIAISIALFAFLGTSSLSAQEWTEDQKAVWKVTEDMWISWQKGDIDGVFAGVHENYTGWSNHSDMPESKAKWLASLTKYNDMQSMRDYNIEPARIHVERNLAVIHYYFTYSYMLDMGEEKKWISHKGKWTSFMIMEKDLWLLIGDFTHSEKLN